MHEQLPVAMKRKGGKQHKRYPDHRTAEIHGLRAVDTPISSDEFEMPSIVLLLPLRRLAIPMRRLTCSAHLSASAHNRLRASADVVVACGSDFSSSAASFPVRSSLAANAMFVRPAAKDIDIEQCTQSCTSRCATANAVVNTKARLEPKMLRRARVAMMC